MTKKNKMTNVYCVIFGKYRKFKNPIKTYKNMNIQKC